MKRSVVVKDIEIVNGKKKVVSQETVPYQDATYMGLALKQDAAKHIEEIGGRDNLEGDHYLIYGQVYGPRGGFKELHRFVSGNDVTDSEFYRLIKEYSYVGAFHK